MPELRDLTPADTSSYVPRYLAQELRVFHSAVEEVTCPSDPSDDEARALCTRLATYDLVVLATVNAFAQPGQAALVKGLLERAVPTVVLAVRMPYDLMRFPQAPTYVCTYSSLQPSLQAAAAVLFGQALATGRQPVSIPGLYGAGA